MDAKERFIVVIGAGVTGLQTAISLLQDGYKVAMIAKHLPGDESVEYTSPWAGAHWRSHASNTDFEQQQWDIDTYKHWLEILKKEQAQPEATELSGLGLRKSLQYSSKPDTPWFSDKVLDYEPNETEKPGSGIQSGHIFTSVMVNVPMYLKYLRQTAESLGATVIRGTIPSSGSLPEALHAASDMAISHFKQSGVPTPHISAIVNATGISARLLVPDSKVYPIRGQTVTVSGEAKQITTVDAKPSNHVEWKNAIVYVLPRPHSNTTILGGTKQVGDWNADPDPGITEEILARAKEWCPELLNEQGDFDVISSQVGLRPARDGGPRVEIEEVDGFVVCHSYGHAGAGYQNSVGSANKVVRLIGQYLK